jgi:hypothetical protein
VVVAAFLDYQPDLQLGDALVAFGTIVLAVFTWRLARQARREVEAQDRPFVVATPPHSEKINAAIRFFDALERDGYDGVPEDTPPEWRFAFRLWNMGKGPAIVDDVTLITADGTNLLAPIETERPVNTGGVRDETTWRLADETSPESGELRISYRDSSRNRYQTTSTVELDDELLTCRVRDYERHEL